VAIDPRTPVIIGVGQWAERIDDADYRGLSPINLAVEAAQAAIVDSGGRPDEIASAIDTIATTRQFENSVPGARAPLGRSTKYPLSVASRIGAQPKRAVLEVSGGQSPQHLVSEFSREIQAGRSDLVLLAGAEAISTVRHLAAAHSRPDFSDDPPGEMEDRGFGLKGLISAEQVAHGLVGGPEQYALLENARRAARGESREKYAESMGALFAPFTKVAAANPYSAAPQERSATELITVTDRNRMIADPYPRFLVARDQVNQGAATLLTSLATARRLGVDESGWVFLHGQADLRERDLFDRAELGSSPAATAAVQHALDVAGLPLDGIDFFDFYSCFPIAVSNITDTLGLSPNDPRGLTLTGGLPYFGGAGNNYAMHAIAEAVARVRSSPGTFALVGANGGVLSKYSVGIYGSTPTNVRPDRSAELQRRIDELTTPAHAAHPDGWARIEAYTVTHGREQRTAIVIGRLESDDRRFVATAHDDARMLELLECAEEPVGERVFVKALADRNCVTVSKDQVAALFPR
jgi:acetyl-CoA C-acetyltransferase